MSYTVIWKKIRNKKYGQNRKKYEFYSLNGFHVKNVPVFLQIILIFLLIPNLLYSIVCGKEYLQECFIMTEK